MKPLGLHVQDYLALRRRLGFSSNTGAIASGDLACFAKENGTSRVTTRLVVRLATRRPNSQASDPGGSVPHGTALCLVSEWVGFPR